MKKRVIDLSMDDLARIGSNAAAIAAAKAKRIELTGRVPATWGEPKQSGDEKHIEESVAKLRKVAS